MATKVKDLVETLPVLDDHYDGPQDDPFEDLVDDQIPAPFCQDAPTPKTKAPTLVAAQRNDTVARDRSIVFWGIYLLIPSIKDWCARLGLACYLDDVATPFNQSVPGYDLGKLASYILVLCRTAFSKANKVDGGVAIDDGVDSAELRKFGGYLRILLQDDRNAMRGFTAETIVRCYSLLNGYASSVVAMADLARECIMIEQLNHDALETWAKDQGVESVYCTSVRQLEEQKAKVKRESDEQYAEYRARNPLY